jgi:quercetin dioxygenase-like cupin family protein
VPIDFLDLLDDEGWKPTDADGAVWHSTRIAPDFGLTGVRLAPGCVVPRAEHDEDVQRIVFGGSVTVQLEDEEGATVGPGQFFLVQAGTPYVLVAGPEGVTYTESWPHASWTPR